MKFVQWLASGVGRVTRVLVGFIMIVAGVAAGGAWIALSIVGIIPLVAGLVGVCLLEALFGRPLQRHHH